MILVYLEHVEDKLTKGALVTINAALAAKKTHGYSTVVGLLLGDGSIEAAAKQAADYGLDRVVFIKDPLLKIYLACNYEQAFKEIIKQLNPQLILALSDSRGKDLMPRIAQYLAAGQSSDTVAFLSKGHFKRPMYAGNIFAEVEITSEKKVATIRSTAFDPAPKLSNTCSVEQLNIPIQASVEQEFISYDTVKSERPELTDATTVVSGGRAFKSAENFEKYLFPLADALDAALGASRAAVDSGYAPNDWQVGQTGKVVAPSLYIAAGISGAIQHLAGMKDSKVIVAINKDPEAPIFEVADYGLVADVFEAIPQLTEDIKKARTS